MQLQFLLHLARRLLVSAGGSGFCCHLLESSAAGVDYFYENEK